MNTNQRELFRKFQAICALYQEAKRIQLQIEYVDLIKEGKTDEANELMKPNADPKNKSAHMIEFQKQSTDMYKELINAGFKFPVKRTKNESTNTEHAQK